MENLAIILDGTATAGAGNGQAQGGASWIGTIIMLVAFVAIFYFLILRPQKKQKKEEQKMRDSLQIGDEVVTIGGVQGKIVSLKEDSFVLESIVDKTKQKYAKWALQQNLTVHDEKK